MSGAVTTEPRPATTRATSPPAGPPHDGLRRFADSSLVQLTLARLRELVREPEAIFWTFVFPIVLALALGIAFSGDRAPVVAVAVVDSPGATPVVEALEAAEDIRVSRLDADAAEAALRDGDAALVVVPGDDGLAYRFDPTREESRLARLAVDDAIQRAAGREDARLVRDEPVRERGSRYIDFLVPGLIGLNLLGTGLWGVGHTIVRLRTGRLLKRLTATPMPRGEFLLSFIFARLAFLVGELAVLLLFAYFAFDVTVAGSLAAVVAVSTLGAFAFTGLGLLIASRVRTTEAVMGLMNLASVPMWILSGVFFSYEHFPEVMHPLIRALPLTPLLDALRAIMLEGAPLVATLPSLGIVAAWGAGCFGLALAIFRWK